MVRLVKGCALVLLTGPLALVGWALGLGLAGLAFLAVSMSWGWVDEQWPRGETKSIRAQVEVVLPAPRTTEVANVWRYGGANDIPYRECVYYRSERQRADIDEYYRATLEGLGWQRVGP